MARVITYSPQQAVPAGAGTVTVPYQSLRGNRVVAYYVAFDATSGNTLADLETLRVIVNGNTWWTTQRSALSRFLSGMMQPKRVDLGTSPGFMIPFFDVMAFSEEAQDQMQLPPGNVELQIVMGAGTAAGSLIVGIVQTDVDPVLTSRLYGQAMNIGAGQVNAPYQFNGPGVLRACSFTMTGVERMTLQLGGIEVIKLTGPDYAPNANLISLLDFYGQGDLIGSPKWFDLGNAYQFPAEGTQLILDTDAVNWGGVNNQFTIYSALPYNAA